MASRSAARARIESARRDGVSRQAPLRVLGVAQDLQEYLLVSMGESVLPQRVPAYRAVLAVGDAPVAAG